MKRPGYWVAVLILLIAIFPVPQAAAQQVCDTREKITDRLHDKYAEFQKLIMLAANGNMVEIFVSGKGSWTMIATHPSQPQIVCAVAAGDGFQVTDEVAPGKAHF